MADLQRDMAETSRNASEQAREAAEWARERAEEQDEEARQRHDELVELRKHEIYKRINPGDYKCPFCLNITLNREASVCPICHKDIPAAYWPPILAAEARRAEEEARKRAAAAEEAARRRKAEAEEEARRKAIAAEEWIKGAPERERRERAAEEARLAAEASARREAQQKVLRNRVNQAVVVAVVVGAGYLVLRVWNAIEEYAHPNLSLGVLPMSEAPLVTIPTGTRRVLDAPLGAWSEPFAIPEAPLQIQWRDDGPVGALRTEYPPNGGKPIVEEYADGINGFFSNKGVRATVRFSSRSGFVRRMRLSVCMPDDCERILAP